MQFKKDLQILPREIESIVLGYVKDLYNHAPDLKLKRKCKECGKTLQAI